MFDIKDYMWNIFEITNYNHIDNIKNRFRFIYNEFRIAKRKI